LTKRLRDLETKGRRDEETRERKGQEAAQGTGQNIESCRRGVYFGFGGERGINFVDPRGAASKPK